MLTPCVGRDEVIDRVRQLVEEHRWVTVTGAPGCGKTLVARHAAAAVPGSLWVTAHAHSSRASLVAACLTALSAEVAPGDSETMALKRALDGRDVLLVLDGVDAVDGLGALLQDLVEETDTWRLLCTAQTVAGRPHERVLRLQPLPAPKATGELEGPAVELLLARVAAAGGHLVDLDTHGPTIRRLITASGGLPLLLEQLAVQIALVGVSDVAPVGSMDEAVRASYALLDEEQQRCFRRLAVIGRPVGLDVIAHGCGVSRAQAVQLASALSRRSLVEVHADGRFAMLAPLREVGRALAAETDDEVGAFEGLVTWADAVLPRDFFSGAANEPWLAELDLLAMAVRYACAQDATRALGYELANRAFSTLYTAMRVREAVDLLESVLDSGDGPPLVGSQLARRAGICASEARGTYEGLRLLERAEQHAQALDPQDRDLEVARTAAIRAEMHLDAGKLAEARADAERTLELGQADPYVVRQVRRTLMDVCVSTGEWDEAERLAALVVDAPPPDELWIALAARVLQAKVAWEQGRLVEAESLARVARERAREIHEDRIALLADTVHRLVTGEPGTEVEPDGLPWAVRLVVQLQEVRELLAAGETAQAAGRAADIVVLADSSNLGRDAVEARLLVGDALMELGEPGQAQASYLSALRRAGQVPLPLRAADALDGLAGLLRRNANPAHRHVAGAAAALRVPRQAVGRDRPGVAYAAGAVRDCPAGWVVDQQLTPEGVAAVTALFAASTTEVVTPLDALTKAERAVAELVAEGLTSRQIATHLFVSPRTVDAHLSHIYRKLEIASRAKLAALMAEVA
ncbi:LuxR C-terminal-related transcriptional regulator [Phycicoccus sp. 3266]|uniref:LuxR C-terminal-related transcriptional regulator n=1 Tax=Phycicoccus sp. 3266 TaxID=2817751 RepID=UPI0028666447|nr:LuxR C-terminal-related transcriptional regulator [Phycicoccus sp. 3266]MDR6863394.1 DNA-binding CsgD family transcriptional regulator/tetratricopeptide (TPR) repeat protein [Phycicoccus sp. 3266]